MPATRDPSESPITRVLIVDPYPAVREALIVRIANQGDLTVCGETAEADEALQLVAKTNPDTVVTDIRLKNGNGIDLIQRLKAREARVAVVVWSMYSESMYAERALRAGAMGYVTKEQATDKILEAIRCVRVGKMYVSNELSARLLQRVVRRNGNVIHESPIEALSNRELQTFELLGQGMATDEIASRLHLSIKTIETYRARIKGKLVIESAADLIRQALLWTTQTSAVATSTAAGSGGASL